MMLRPQILSDAQAELNHQKDLQAQAVNALADAKAATSRANDALAQATTKLNNANAALKHRHNRYGLRCITMLTCTAQPLKLLQ